MPASCPELTLHGTRPIRSPLHTKPVCREIRHANFWRDRGRRAAEGAPGYDCSSIAYFKMIDEAGFLCFPDVHQLGLDVLVRVERHVPKVLSRIPGTPRGASAANATSAGLPPRRQNKSSMDSFRRYDFATPHSCQPSSS
jgi:hypothetical protein